MIMVQLAQNVQFANALVPCLLMNPSLMIMGNDFTRDL